MPHLLKRLELNGFKSFAQKTVLEFPAGITAIVGPNGSGKSNVVDAIRWLLGEREAKNLRGARVDDLIFAGTAKRPRLGMAQASLHFDNGSGFFPAEFTEISVSRQVSRDGVSKYFLNKSEILLRDLIDFFAKARLGSRGLVIVTQGNSDVFIQATPQERREMIEEILGLREYQLKKSDAEKRLKNTQINLDKARALIEEILPHLRSLKRQTSKWEKRGELEEELRGLEDVFFGVQLEEIREKSAKLGEKLNAEKAHLATLERERKSAEEKQSRLEAGQPEERKELKEIRGRVQEFLSKRSGLEKELGRLEAMAEMGRAKAPAGVSSEGVLKLIKEIKTELRVGLEGDMVELRSAAESAVEMIDEFLSGRAVDGAVAGKGGNSVNSQSTESPEIRAQLEKVKKGLVSIEEEVSSLKKKEQLLESGQEEFYTAFKAAVGEVEAARDKIEKWELRNREIMFEIDKLKFRQEEIEKQIVQAGRKPEEFLRFEGAGDTDSSQAERRIFKLRGDLASMGEVDEALVREAGETESRYEFIKKESEDLDKAVSDLNLLISELDEKIKTEFEGALTRINAEFVKLFELMFGGGHGRLKIEKIVKEQAESGEKDEEKPAEEESGAENETAPITEGGGVLVEVKLPRKRISSLETLSGGERSLVGIAAIFALISVSPPPFLVLDEIDAALDERNARRFSEMLKEFSKETQFVVVTHNRATMEAADVLYGITLNDDGTSKVVSLKLEQ